MKTLSAEAVVDLFLDKVCEFFTDKISGSVYTESLRPIDSKKEDAVLLCTTITAGQYQEGVLKVNIYVQDADYGIGFLAPNTSRIISISKMYDRFVDFLEHSFIDFHFQKQKAPRSFKEEGKDEHYVSMAVNFTRTSINSIND